MRPLKTGFKPVFFTLESHLTCHYATRIYHKVNPDFRFRHGLKDRYRFSATPL